MSHSVESELKYSLERRDYLRLLFRLPKAHRVDLQKNTYFDTPDLFLRTRRMGLRVRIISGRKAVLTLKYPSKAPSNLTHHKIRREIETPIPLRVAKRLLNGSVSITEVPVAPVRMLLRKIPAGQARRIGPLGTIENKRHFIRKSKFTFELDSFRMFGARLYELEVETTQPKRADQLVQALLEKNDIAYEPMPTSKLARFLKTWRRVR